MIALQRLRAAHKHPMMDHRADVLGVNGLPATNAITNNFPDRQTELIKKNTR